MRSGIRHSEMSVRWKPCSASDQKPMKGSEAGGAGDLALDVEERVMGRGQARLPAEPAMPQRGGAPLLF